MKRWQNYGLWVSIASLIGMILNDAFQISPEDYNRYVDVIFAILIAAGIISNPKEGKWFNDDKNGGEQ